MLEYNGGCLCNETTFTAKGEPTNPHLCSCTMCQKSSGSPTVAWLEFSLEVFQWNCDNQLGLYRSSEKTQRCFCQKCGSFLGAINDGSTNISIVIAALENSNQIIPGRQHSYKESAPLWWEVNIVKK